jgi:hypothetical protein
MVETVEDSLEEAIHLAGGEALVLAAGSIFIAAGARNAWFSQKALAQRQVG